MGLNWQGMDVARQPKGVGSHSLRWNGQVDCGEGLGYSGHLW